MATPVSGGVGVGRKRKRTETHPNPATHSRRRKEKENEKETIVLEALDLIPLEIWYHIAQQVPDASTFLAFARTCRTFAHAAHELQDVMKDAFSLIQAGSYFWFTWTEFVLPSGQRHGEYEEAHANGNKFTKGIYHNGKEEGKWITWYVNGQKEREGSYRDGHQEGKWTWWYENGEIEEEEFFYGPTPEDPDGS